MKLLQFGQSVKRKNVLGIGVVLTGSSVSPKGGPALWGEGGLQ